MALGCIEEFPAETQNLQTLLVVDAVITDVPNNHKVELTRIFSFEADEPTAETGALVRIVNDQGIEFVFVGLQWFNRYFLRL